MSYPDAIEVIKKKALRLKLSQVKLAEIGGVSTSYLSRIFSMEREASDQVLMNLARAVNIPPLEILQTAKRVPFEPEQDQTLYRISHLYHTLRDDDSKKKALEYLEFLLQQEEQDEKRK